MVTVKTNGLGVSDALNYLATSADDYAQAVQDEARLEHLIKNTKAELIGISDQKTQAAKEAWAMSQSEYRKLCEDEYPLARRRVAYHRAKQKWAEEVISVWQTQNANKRAAERVR